MPPTSYSHFRERLLGMALECELFECDLAAEPSADWRLAADCLAVADDVRGLAKKIADAMRADECKPLVVGGM